MLTDRQRQTYDFLNAYIARHGSSPKLREIADHLGIHSRGTVHRYLRALRTAGLIDIESDRMRGVQLVGAGNNQGQFRLPLAGRIAAGQPIEAIPDHDTVDLSEFLIGPNRFVLKVTGDSMIEAGILDGDMVVVEQRSDAANREIVVALIDNDEATLKYLQKNEDGSITLKPANQSMPSMRYPEKRVQIQGVVVAQLRSYR